MAGRGYSSCCEVIKCKEPNCNNQITLQGWGKEKEFCGDCIKQRYKRPQREAWHRRKAMERSLN